MSNTKRYLVFDFGASNGRTFAGDYDGTSLILREIHRFGNRPVYMTGSLYWDLPRLFSELQIGLQKAFDDPRDKSGKNAEIRSLGIDTWGVDCGFIDPKGRLVANPFNYRDEGRGSVFDEAVQAVGEDVLFSKAGVFILPINTLFHLYYLLKSGAKELASGNKMLNMPDLFNYLLTGIARNEYSIITTSSCYNIEEKRFADEILTTLGIDQSIFCETVQPGTRLGPVRKDLADAVGIPQVPVSAVAGHDTASAIAGIPLDTQSGDVYLSLGTWGICGAETEKARLDKEARESGFGNEGGADGGIFLAKNVTGLWIIQQCREQWMRESGKHISWDVIVNEAGKAAAFTSFIDPDDPVFAGAQPKMADTVAEYCMKTGQKSPAGIGETARCIFESLVLRFKENFDVLESLRGRPAKKVHLAGGGSKNCLICQWTADALGVPVETGPDEAAVLGNLIMQLKADGEISDLQEGRRIVQNSISSSSYGPQSGSQWKKEMEKFKSVTKKVT